MATQKEAEHILRNVKKQSFNLHMGTNITNLKELEEALDIMADRTFHHHVTQTRNDFSTWVENALGDEELAARIKGLKSRENMKRHVTKRILELESKLAQSHVTSKELMSIGAVDFVIGMIIGFIGGLILAAMFGI